MLNPKDMEKLMQSFTPKTRRIFTLLEQHGHDVDAMRAAHPEITQQDIDDGSDETLKNLQRFFGKSPGPAKPGKRKKNAEPGAAYQFKITLRGSKPPIWRRVVVPADITLSLFHDVIQAAMGWSNCHLHSFEIHDEEYRDCSTGDWDAMEGKDESQYRLDTLVTHEKTRFYYEYDFGDGWDHIMVLEKIIPASESPPTIVCTDGKGRCPFEDCGGIYGYYHMLSILANPTHPEHTQMLEWAGEVPNPEEFDIAEANARLAGIYR